MISLQLYCAVPENIHTPPQKGLEFHGGGGFCKTNTFKEMYEAKSAFPEGRILQKSLLWGRYGYTLMSQNNEMGARLLSQTNPV